MANVYQYHPSQKITYTGGKKVYLEGLEKVVKEINENVGKIMGVTEEGLYKAMAHVHRKAEPATPVRTGALISSWFVVGKTKTTGRYFKLNIGKKLTKQQNANFKINKITEGKQKRIKFAHRTYVRDMKAILDKGQDMVVIGGYSVPYAGYIHEAIAGKNMAKHFTRPGSHAWWLQEAFNNSRDDIMKIIRQNIKV